MEEEIFRPRSASLGSQSRMWVSASPEMMQSKCGLTIVLVGLATALFLVDEVCFLLVGESLYFPLPLHGF